MEKLTDPPQGHSLGDSGQSVSGGSAAGAADGTVLCPQSRHVGCISFHRGHVIRNEACIRVVPEQYFYHHDVFHDDITDFTSACGKQGRCGCGPP